MTYWFQRAWRSNAEFAKKKRISKINCIAPCFFTFWHHFARNPLFSRVFSHFDIIFPEIPCFLVCFHILTSFCQKSPVFSCFSHLGTLPKCPPPSRATTCNSPCVKVALLHKRGILQIFQVFSSRASQASRACLFFVTCSVLRVVVVVCLSWCLCIYLWRCGLKPPPLCIPFWLQAVYDMGFLGGWAVFEHHWWARLWCGSLHAELLNPNPKP